MRLASSTLVFLTSGGLALLLALNLWFLSDNVPALVGKDPSLVPRQTGTHPSSADVLPNEVWKPRVAKSLLRTPLRSLGPKGTSREHMHYYDTLFFLALQFGHDANSLLEVGCAADPFSSHLSWIGHRLCVAPYHARYGSGQDRRNSTFVQFVKADFAKWTPPMKKYDLVLCSQVVEHVPDPANFTRKLVGVGTTSIVSVPHDWDDCGPSCTHVTHHITLDTILNWVHPLVPILSSVVKDGRSERLFVVFDQRS